VRGCGRAVAAMLVRKTGDGDSGKLAAGCKEWGIDAGDGIAAKVDNAPDTRSANGTLALELDIGADGAVA
jgi:hypothetical protein